MSKKPIINALAAFGYIVLIVLIISLGERFAPKQDNLLMPMAGISVFTLSAAVMGYLFGYQPAQLYFDGKKKEGVKLFLQTVGVFGVITICILAASFFGSGVLN